MQQDTLRVPINGYDYNDLRDGSVCSRDVADFYLSLDDGGRVDTYRWRCYQNDQLHELFDYFFESDRGLIGQESEGGVEQH